MIQSLGYTTDSRALAVCRRATALPSLLLDPSLSVLHAAKATAYIFVLISIKNVPAVRIRFAAEDLVLADWIGAEFFHCFTFGARVDLKQSYVLGSIELLSRMYGSLP